MWNNFLLMFGGKDSLKIGTLPGKVQLMSFVIDKSNDIEKFRQSGSQGGQSKRGGVMAAEFRLKVVHILKEYIK